MENTQDLSRRKFFKQASVLGAATMATPGFPDAFPLNPDPQGSEHFTFLFQGDSITDGNRTRDLDWNHVMGHGYAYLIAADLLFRYPERKFHFFNRGVSGNKVTDLAQRWREDTIGVEPDLLSILIGINDTSAAVYGDKNSTTTVFEKVYRDLLTETRQKLPATKLVICEPFVLPVGDRKDKWDNYLREITGRQQVAQKLAVEFDAVFIPLQESFNQAAKKYPPDDYWLWDGVHPMPNGHELIAREWMSQVGKNLKFIR